MKFNVHGGHNSIVPGASGLLDETKEDRKVKNGVISRLKVAGHTVYDCTDDKGRTQGANLANIVAKCNKHTVDYDASIHLNSGRKDKKGDGKTGGVEVLIFSEEMKYIAKAVADAIAEEFGYALRSDSTTPAGFAGVKIKKSLYVLKRTKNKAMLIECCFVDDADDVKVWDADRCAGAIVKGLTGKTVSDGSTKPTGGNSKPGASKPSTSSAEIKVDGWWGVDTTKLLQKIFGTPVDGIVSNQDPAQKKYLLRADSKSWDFKGKGNGSNLIGAMQKKVGVKDDGFMGPKTIKAWQKYLGVSVDGKMGEKTVKALQKWANKQA